MQKNSSSSSSLLSSGNSIKSVDGRFATGKTSVSRDQFSSETNADGQLSKFAGGQSMASLDEARNMDEGNKYPNTTDPSPPHNTTIGLAAGPIIYPELDRYRNHEHPALTSSRYGTDALYKLSTEGLPSPLTPHSILFSASSSQLSAISASPSTKFSESPGPGLGPYSRDTTPTSMSSQSPGLVAPIRGSNVSKATQLSLAKSRPPVTRRRANSFSNDAESTYIDPQGLAAVRESLTSSSSNSTVRDDKGTASRKKPTKLPPPPPSPPPRKSSQKFRSNVEKRPPNDKSKAAPALSTQDNSKTATEVVVAPARPNRPSRHGTPDLKSQLFDPVPVIKSNLRSRPNTGIRRGSDSTTIPSPLSPSKGRKSASTSNLPSQTAIDESSRPRRSEDTKSQESSPKPASSSSRFTLFGKKAASASQGEKKESRKLTRKGPAAGTGHEGYGRLGSVRRRSGSQNLTFNYAGPQLSQESVTSEDSFFADRMNPVVIIGGGGDAVGATNTSLDLGRTTSNKSQPTPRSSTDSQPPSEENPAITANNSTTSLQPISMPRPGEWLASNSMLSSPSDSDEAAFAPNLALRRSAQRLKTSPGTALRLPQPINTTGTSHSPMTSLDTSVTSGESHFGLGSYTSEELHNAHPAPRKLRKKAKSPRKWNFFGRSQNNESKKSSSAVSATVTAVEKRPLPFYAMMDAADQEQNDDLDVQAVLRHAGLYQHNQPKLTLDTKLEDSSTHTVQTAPFSQKAASSAAQMSRKPSRLQHVGRIPQVVGRGDEKPSPKSFSRPFRASMQRPVSIPVFYDPESIAKGPSPPRSSTPLPDLVMEGSTLETSTLPSTNRGSLDNETEDTPAYAKEFLTFSPRKYSSGTTGTSSSSSAFGAFATATAIIPNPGDPPAEDEVWNEYDDLLGDDTLKVPQSATSSKGIPFHLETYHQRLIKTDDVNLESPVVADNRKVSTCSTNFSLSSYCSDDMTERIKAAFKPHASPAAGATFEIDTSEKKEKSSGLDTAELKRQSSSSSKSRHSTGSSSSFDYSSPLAQVNLRVGSMTVSKWLTFGHVLFSDLRHELLATKKGLPEKSQHSILIVDGLGNDDWSFYVAETYPEAHFFNLSPRAPMPKDFRKADPGSLRSPSNHHQVQYLSHTERFPFAPQSFDSVVYRFPVAAPKAHYRNIVSESRRVLKPGGYIELAILDLDLNNMGNRGRRKIRQLKESIHEASPDSSLGSAADIILRFLGNGGFSSIKAAKVGVPVASSITQSDVKDKGAESSNRPKNPPSLSDMMKDTSPAADANITKMVTRVGRWWYTRCYESAASSLARQGIWADKALIRECQDMGTSLKLTVCCARAPKRVPSY